MEELYIGIDAHKVSNLVALAFEGQEDTAINGKVSADLNRATVDLAE